MDLQYANTDTLIHPISPYPTTDRYIFKTYFIIFHLSSEYGPRIVNLLSHIESIVQLRLKANRQYTWIIIKYVENDANRPA